MGKRSDVDDYRIQKRGGKGLINLKPTEKSDLVAAVREVTDDDELMFVTRNGVINRQPAEGIRVIGRNTKGVRLVALDEGDELVDVACLIDPIGTDEEEENPETDATVHTEGDSELSGADDAEAGDAE